jgi:hypothetical protein
MKQGLLFGLLLASVLLEACAASSTPDGTLAAAASPAATLPGAPTPASGTAQSASTPLPTPVPVVPDTLNTHDLHTRLNPLSPELAGCDLPCYNGLLPGTSDLQAVRTFYARLAIGSDDVIPGDNASVRDGTGHLRAWLTKATDVLQSEELGFAPPLVDVNVENGLVVSAAVGWRYQPAYLTPLLVLDTLGLPERLELALVFDLAPVRFGLLLIYPDLQTGFAYYGVAIGDPTTLQVCLHQEQVDTVIFGTFAPDVPVMQEATYASYMLPLSEHLGLSATELLELFRADSCLTIPADRWAVWQDLSED